MGPAEAALAPSAPSGYGPVSSGCNIYKQSQETTVAKGSYLQLCQLKTNHDVI